MVRRTMTLSQLGLSGAEYQLRITDPEHLTQCAVHLIHDGHGHHFAVVGEGETLAVSSMALTCLREAGLLGDVDA